MRRVVLYILIFLLSNKILGANILQFSHYTVDDGLPQNTVHSIIQDKYGFMWFGTWHGLSKFDGKVFKNYYHSSTDTTSLINNRVHLLYKDIEGDIWVSTFDTIVCKYNYETDNFTRFNPSELPINIRDSTDRRNISYYREVAHKDTKWRVANNSLVQTNIKTGDSYQYLSSVFNDFSLSSDVVYSLFIDQTKTLWVGTGMGVNYVNLLSNNIFYKPLVIQKEGTFIKSAVRAILVDDDNVWLASNNHGVTKTNLKEDLEYTTSFKNNEFKSSVPRTIYKDSKGIIWFGFRMSIASYNPETDRVYNYREDEFARYPVYVIKEDNDNELWAGSFNSLLKYNRKYDSFFSYALPHNNEESSVMDFYFDKNKNIWVCTELSGLLKLKIDSLTNDWTDVKIYSNSQGKDSYIPDNRVYSICQDRKGNIWIATGDGLCQIDEITGEVEIFDKKNGLVESYISKVIALDEYVWFSHKQGVSRINIYSSEVENFHIKNELGNYEFVDGSGYYDKSTSTLYFGGLDGYVSLKPHDFENLDYLPDVKFTNLYVRNKTIKVGEKYSANNVLEKPIYMTDEIYLAYTDNSFSIDFSVIHYSNPVANRFVFKLEGYDKDFFEIDSKKQSVTYNGLKPGKYKLTVNTINNYGLQGSNPASLSVIVNSPWWVSWWAYTIYFVFLTAIFLTIYYILKIKLSFKHQIEIERVEKEKIKELQSFRTNFFTSISHELRNPVTLIIDPVERLINGLVKGEDKSRYLNLIQNNAQRLLNILNQFLAFKKIEEGSESIKEEMINVESFFHRIYSMFEIKALTKSINYNIDVNCKDYNIVVDIDKIEKIVYNLLENAFKYTPDNGSVSLNVNIIEKDIAILKISVIDNGIGILETEKDKIFDFFYRSETLKNSFESYGVGLPYVKELILLLKGKVYVESSLNKGATFTVEIPVRIEDDIIVEKDNKKVDVDKVKDYNEADNDKTILIVEDNPEIRSYLGEILSSLYNVITATNGEEGFESTLKNIPDLIITDVFMPVISGTEFCEMVKNDMRTCHIPVIMLTSLSSVDSQLQGLEAGADVYLTKPFNSSVLFAQIKSLLKKYDSLKNALLQDNIKVDEEEESKFIVGLKQIIRENIESRLFDVESLAEKLNLSRSQLYRKVKNESEYTVSQIITTIRMDYAKELLVSSDKNVTEVSDLIGYSEPNNFSRAFQNYFGAPPKDFIP